jgi:hypothetical protein
MTPCPHKYVYDIPKGHSDQCIIQPHPRVTNALCYKWHYMRSVIFYCFTRSPFLGRQLLVHYGRKSLPVSTEMVAKRFPIWTSLETAFMMKYIPITLLKWREDVNTQRLKINLGNHEGHCGDTCIFLHDYFCYFLFLSFHKKVSWSLPSSEQQ